MNTCRPSNTKIALTLSYMLLLLASSAIPMDRQVRGLKFIINLKPTIQNILHMPMYAVLAILFLQISQNYQLKSWKRNLVVLLVSGCFGLVNEIIQIAVPGRFGGLIDVGLNLIGAIIGMLTYILVEKSKTGIIRHIICD